MPLYEHVFIARQDLSSAQAETMMTEFTEILGEGGGQVVGNEYWGLRSMAYKINKNRKGHYAFLKLDAPAAAVAELERRQRLHEDVMRVMTIRVDSHEEGPSAIVTAKNSRDDRRGGRGRDRGDRPPREDRGDRPPREDRGDRPPREDRGDRPPRDEAPAVEAPAAAPAAAPTE
ncbi:MAG: 30S ribosomal protein S6 [Rhodobacteraceae bacterium]|nr:30S ribosomal protein S6 [Paracoccaceae bacterium]